ncbi:hypothetical protein [Microbacterium sp.]|uniref:hypothetical protein n=1 Tax=Microbacterium sp. TaxID=51671 RepID=UPI003A8D2498
MTAVSCTVFTAMILFSVIAGVRAVALGEPTGGAVVVFGYGVVLGLVSAGPAALIAAQPVPRPVLALLISSLAVIVLAMILYVVADSSGVRLSVGVAVVPAGVVASFGAALAVAVRPNRRSTLSLVTSISAVALIAILVVFERVSA